MPLFNKIIVIDDDPVYSFITTELIESSTLYEQNLISYKNGVRALRDFVETDLNKLKLLIFVDLDMPIMDGWEFLDELTKSELNPLNQIYIVSSTVNLTVKEKALSYPIVKDYISKPLLPEKLIEIENAAHK